MLKSMLAGIVSRNLKKKLISNTITAEDLESTLREVRIALLDSDVNFRVVKNFLQKISDSLVGQYLEKGQSLEDKFLLVLEQELVSMLGTNSVEIDLSGHQTNIMMIGLQGSGKTTSAAKIARWIKNKNKAVRLVALDTYRPAAIEQLQILGKKIDVEVFAEFNKPVQEIAENSMANGIGKSFVNIIDTAGRLAVDENLILELKKLKTFYQPKYILFVADAMSGQDVINVATTFHKEVGINGIVITKMDSNAKAGAALSLRATLDVPILFTGTGESIESLDLFHPDRVAERILGLGDLRTLVDKATEQIDEKKAKSQFEKILSGKMDLEDLYEQMATINRMGSLGQIAQMLPGGAKIGEQDIENLEAKLKIWKILMSSMTKKERRDPKIFEKEPTRKIRVLKGSGRKPDEFNKMMSDFKKAQDQLKNLGQAFRSGKNPLKGFM